MTMIKIAVILLSVFLSTPALGDPTRPSVQQHVFPKPLAERHSPCDSIIKDCEYMINEL